MEIFVDDAIFDDGQRAVKNANKDYNVGTLRITEARDNNIILPVCHTEYDQPDAIRSVLRLIDCDIDDNMILEGGIDDRLKATFEPSDTDSFQFNVPNGVTGSNTFNKLQQTDNNSAFYIKGE